jgi:hypothetical protein
MFVWILNLLFKEERRTILRKGEVEVEADADADAE